MVSLKGRIIQKQIYLKNRSKNLYYNYCITYILRKGAYLRGGTFMKVIAHDGSISDVAFSEEEGKKAFWHTASHILAQAVKRLYPETKLTIGPAIKEGFYYDFDRETPFTVEDFDAIEAEMKKIVKENLPLRRKTLSREEALEKI